MSNQEDNKITTIHELCEAAKLGKLPRDESEVDESLHQYWKFALLIDATSRPLPVVSKAEKELQVKVVEVEKKVSVLEEANKNIAGSVSDIEATIMNVMTAAQVVNKIGDENLTKISNATFNSKKELKEPPPPKVKDAISVNTDSDIFSQWFCKNIKLANSGGARDYFLSVAPKLGFEEKLPPNASDAEMDPFARRLYDYIKDEVEKQPRCKSLYNWFVAECSKAKK